MNTALQEFARQTLKDGLGRLPAGSQRIFKLMYGRGAYVRGEPARTVEETESLTIHQVVDEMAADKLDWAMQQVERTLQKQ